MYVSLLGENVVLKIGGHEERSYSKCLTIVVNNLMLSILLYRSIALLHTSTSPILILQKAFEPHLPKPF